ncbi:Very-short-patch-repair endonuclease [Flagellimonas taeanensis]|uniref:Very-short-patch-repair endonuclease n=1 Tax=Flagellimonas taeanensis TaxID=1005926 RepID=A0A1M6YYN8_9FLAO|nr:endonuclease domain-containing protein [Allomuricauda taeanensis]SFC13146.1 Very-short-patch-repair endonuclease [Allomuricauda taeanensis]SHL23179.1 Very-short-patch-repair endonuclease [Allomuricauda taeanensis]
MKKRIHNRKELIQFRKKLRNNATPAEAFLWRHLKAKKLCGRRFNRQHSIKNYIVDFYCAAEKLVIELDGAVHQSSKVQEYDKKRTEILNELGYTVIRLENKMVFENLESVLSEISEHFKQTP